MVICMVELGLGCELANAPFGWLTVVIMVRMVMGLLV